MMMIHVLESMLRYCTVEIVEISTHLIRQVMVAEEEIDSSKDEPLMAVVKWRKNRATRYQSVY